MNFTVATTSLTHDRLFGWHPVERSTRRGQLDLGGTGVVDFLDNLVAVRDETVARLDDGNGDMVSWQVPSWLRWARDLVRAAPVPVDLDEAVELARQAITAVPATEPDPAVNLNNLGTALLRRFQQTGMVADIDEAVEVIRQAIIVSPADSANVAGMFGNLGVGLRIRFERTDAVGDLDEAVELIRRAIDLTASDDPDVAMYSSNLSTALQTRFERLGVLADIEEAVGVARQAIAATLADDPDAAGRLSTLGVALWTRFGRTGVTADLEEAIGVARQAIAITPAEDPDLAGFLTNLGNALQDRFERTGATTDLDESVEAARQAVAVTPTGHPSHAMYLNNLGTALWARFDRTGATTDLDEAIDLARQSVAVTPAGHANLAGLRNTLSVVLTERFERTGVMADLDEAIETVRQAVTVTPTADPDIVMYLNNFETALQTRFERTSVMADLDEAIEVARQTITVIPADHTDHAALLSNLATGLQIRSEQTGVRADLDAAVEMARQAATLTRADHPDLAGYLTNLGNALWIRFEQTGMADDLDEAVEVAGQAVALTPADQPYIAIQRHSLGVALATRFRRTGATADRDRAVESFRRAVDVVTVAPWRRIRAARDAADLLTTAKPGEAAELLDQAVRLLPETAPRQLNRSDKQYAIGQFEQLASDAAALALSDSDAQPAAQAGSALRLLELGRAVIMQQALSLRGETGQLADAHPDLAAEFVRLRDLLDSDPTPAPVDSTTLETVAAELEQVLTRIRTKPGFESFALPPALGELLAQACEGPIVVFNISRYRSDALLVSPTTIIILPLPALTLDTVTDHASAFLHAIDTAHNAGSLSEQRAAQQRLRATLEWLWDNATGPVLDALGYRGPAVTGEPLPRVWWVPTGPLSQLPLHAAGYHSDPARTVIDRVVSSYTPTITALRHARAHHPAPSAHARALVVAMPTTPAGPNPLNHAVTEVATIESRFPGATVLIEPGTSDPSVPVDLLPTKANVLARLPAHSIAHFCCHGINDTADPARSCLLLHDHTTGALTVADLDSVRLENAQLAYLSACETAAATTPELLDETIHLVSAFQLAGYSHVIGTLWPVNDRAAATIADAFYRALPGGPDSSANRAAHALHQTIIATRDRYPNTPSLWAAHLHTGA